MTTQAQEDGYVECGECGHAVEQHNEDGCEICQSGGDNNCPDRHWTEAEIKRVRVREGLTADWRI